jgi:hypothetical protein
MARLKLLGTKKKRTVTGKPRKSRRRRKMGAAGSLEPILMNGAAVGVGVVAARELSILLGVMMPSLAGTPIMTGAIQIGAGLAAAMMAPNGFVSYMGLGAMGEGIMTAIVGTGIISGPPQTMTYAYNRRQMGDPRLQFVAGPYTRIGSPPNPIPVVAGYTQRSKKRSFLS